MKKIVSLMALYVVLFGTVMTVTGCGNKPNKDSVWETTKQNGVTVPSDKVQYWCFHSDGNVYQAFKLGGNEVFRKAGKYEIYDKLKKIAIITTYTYGGQTQENTTAYDYTITGDKLTLKLPYEAGATSYEMKKSKKYNASDMKAKAK